MAGVSMQDGPIQWNNAPPAEAQLVGRCVGLVYRFEHGMGRDFRERCIRFFRQYRGFRAWRDAWESANKRNDRDGLLYDAKQAWGAHLHIPLSFRTIESIVPKAIAQAPKGLILPLDEQWRDNVKSLQVLTERQQEQIDIDLALQDVMRAGRIYGLGVGKSYWLRKVVNKRRQERAFFGGGYREGPLRQVVVFDDPMFEDVDVFDFMWDERAHNVETAEWVCHRIWMSTEQVLRRLQEGVWNTQSAAQLTPDEVSKLGPDRRHFDEVWRERMTISGFGTAFHSDIGRASGPHELLEFHDGERVLTILDRRVLVQDAENPSCGIMPFAIYRPVPVQKMMVGIGDLEPLEDLQRELNTLRSQRRDLVTLTLAAGFLYDPTMIRPEDLVFGPNKGIPVRGDVNEAFKQIAVRDVPGSAWQDEQAIRQDFEAVSGIADALDNTPGGTSTTATEAQLVQASLGRRIELGSRRFEIEVVRQMMRCFIDLDQRMISEGRPDLVMPDPALTPEEAADAGAYHRYPIGPAQLEGDFEYVVEGGSMAAKNIPQERADANQMANLLLGSPMMNRARVLEQILERLGVKHPQTWMRSPEPNLPQIVLPILQAAGVDPELLDQAVIRANTIANPEGPNVEQVTSLMGGQSSPEAGGGFGESPEPGQAL